MADNDGEVRIATTLDTKDLQQQIDKLKNKLNQAGNDINKNSSTTKKFGMVLNEVSGSAAGFADKLSSVATAGGPYVAAAVAAIAATKKIGDIMRDCTETYKVQERAENALAIAAKNNPYLNDEGVYNLRNFASELQSFSEIGDEVSLQIMSQLAATGRNEEQIMSIMSAAVDMAAGTGNSVQNVAMQLNKTYSGLAGELGEANGAIRALTKEELENGKAVDVLSEKYKGMAQSMADARVQAQNAKGDFKEAIGQITSPTHNLWDNFWKTFYEKGTEYVNKFNRALDKWAVTNGSARSKWLDEQVELMARYNEDTQKTLASEQTPEYLKSVKYDIELRKEKQGLTAKEQQAEIFINEALKRQERTQRYITEEAEKEAESKRKAAELATKPDEYARQSNAELDKALKKLELEAELKGQSVNAQDKYNIILQNYINLLTETENTIAKGYPVEQKRLEQLQAAKKELQAAQEEEKKLQAAINATTSVLESLEDMSINPTPINTLAQQQEQYRQLRATIEALSEEEIEAGQKDAEVIFTKQQLIDGLMEKEKEYEKSLIQRSDESESTYYNTYKQQQQALIDLKKSINDSEVMDAEEKNAELLKIDEEYAKNKANLWHYITTQIQEYTQQTADIAQKFGDLMLKNVQTETDLELAKLDEKYEKGEMSEEQYYEKQKAIKRKAAQEEYKIQMFQWTASILAATANIAEGVSKAIAQGGTAGLITGALVGAAGAVQIASIIASKPVPPQFYAGGIIGGANGATYGSDNTYIHARTGEMVLNAHQQRNLWDMINGQDSRQQAGLNLTVNNTQANRVDADVREQDGEVFIDILDKHINKGFTDGTYDAGLAAMNTRQEGVRIL